MRLVAAPNHMARRDRHPDEIDAGHTRARPPAECPLVYQFEVHKLEDGGLILKKHQVSWLLMFHMAKSGFVTSQAWASRWPKHKIRADAIPHGQELL